MSKALSLWKYLWNKQKGKCFYCNVQMRKNGNNKVGSHNQPYPDTATIDHYVPKSIIPKEIIGVFRRRGYKYNPNLVLACFKCNNKKADKIPNNWDGTYGPYKYQNGGWMWIGIDSKLCNQCRDIYGNTSLISGNNMFWENRCNNCGRIVNE
jgi:hypothetical protein